MRFCGGREYAKENPRSIFPPTLISLYYYPTQIKYQGQENCRAPTTSQEKENDKKTGFKKLIWKTKNTQFGLF